MHVGWRQNKAGKSIDEAVKCNLNMLFVLLLVVSYMEYIEIEKLTF